MRPHNQDFNKEATRPPPLFLSAVEFQVATQTQSLTASLGSSVSLHCGFSMAPGLDLISVEWRQQHQGRGQQVYSWTSGKDQAKRQGATLDPDQLHMARNASLTLPGLTVKDEGTHICQITTSRYQAQQIIQLNIQGEARTRPSWSEGEGRCPLGEFFQMGI